MAKSPDKVALAALEAALNDVVAAVKADPSPATVRRVRDGLSRHFEAVEKARSEADPVSTPLTSFDPSDPKTVGRMVSMALLAQPMGPLGAVKPAYGSGVYAIYYNGDHPLYARISRTETPIYVGKADPSNGDASTAREQGPRLTGRLIEHAGTIATAEKYASENPLREGAQPDTPRGLHVPQIGLRNERPVGGGAPPHPNVLACLEFGHQGLLGDEQAWRCGVHTEEQAFALGCRPSWAALGARRATRRQRHRRGGSGADQCDPG